MRALHLSQPAVHGGTVRLQPFRGLQPGFSLVDSIGDFPGTGVVGVYLDADLDAVRRACEAFNAVMDAAERASIFGEHAVQRALEDA